ncbi:hypothetical protein [Caminibacter sp.]
MKLPSLILIAAGTLFFTGCATKTVNNEKTYLKSIDYIVKQQKQKRIEEETDTKSYHFMVKPIISSEQDDSKVVVDMGKILKIWIAPYVVKGTLIAGHSIYTWVEPPKFIAGESVGRGSYSDASLITPNGNYPLIYRPDEVYTKKAKFSNEELRNYVNKKYETEKHPAKVIRKIEKNNVKYDEEIKKYLQMKKRTKK